LHDIASFNIASYEPQQFASDFTIKDSADTYVYRYNSQDNKWRYTFTDADGSTKTYDIDHTSNSSSWSGSWYDIYFIDQNGAAGPVRYKLSEQDDPQTTIPHQ
jgi:hypothetical protein